MNEIAYNKLRCTHILKEDGMMCKKTITEINHTLDDKKLLKIFSEDVKHYYDNLIIKNQKLLPFYTGCKKRALQ